MPIYAFRCPKCRHEYEELVPRAGEKAPCPNCGETRVELIISAPAAHGGKGRASDCGTTPSGGYR